MGRLAQSFEEALIELAGIDARPHRVFVAREDRVALVAFHEVRETCDGSFVGGLGGERLRVRVDCSRSTAESLFEPADAKPRVRVGEPQRFDRAKLGQGFVFLAEARLQKVRGSEVCDATLRIGDVRCGEPAQTLHRFVPLFQ